MAASLAKQAERLFRTFSDLVRRYQFRDREGICCHGLSVSQCYTLEMLYEHEPKTMGELASALHLELSTMTRVVDYLVTNKLASRVQDRNDRRICRVRITKKGAALTSKIRADLIQEHAQVLKQIPAESRGAVITAVSLLLEAIKRRQQGCC